MPVFRKIRKKRLCVTPYKNDWMQPLSKLQLWKRASHLLVKSGFQCSLPTCASFFLFKASIVAQWLSPFAFQTGHGFDLLSHFFYRQFFPLIAFLFFLSSQFFFVEGLFGFLIANYFPQSQAYYIWRGCGSIFFSSSHTYKTKAPYFLSYFLLSTTPMFSKKKK